MKFLKTILIIIVLFMLCTFGLSLVSDGGFDLFDGTAGGGSNNEGNAGGNNGENNDPVTPPSPDSQCKHLNDIVEEVTQLGTQDTSYLTMHNYSAKCYSCGKQLVENILVSHAFSNGVCACGYACDHPSANEDGYCVKCGSPLMIQFTIYKDVFSVDVGTTWADFIQLYNLGTIDDNGRIITTSKECIVDIDGFPVLSHQAIISNYNYAFCLHEAANVVIEKHSSIHHIANVFCKTCDLLYHSALMEHNYENAVCKDCAEICSNHKYRDGACNICGLKCSHNMVDGVCSICSYGCEHIWEDSVCKICNLICSHAGENFDDGNCSVCGYSAVVVTVDGITFNSRGGTTWADIVARYSANFGIKDGYVYYNAVALLDAQDEKVEAQDLLVHGAIYGACKHLNLQTVFTNINDLFHSKKSTCNICGNTEAFAERHNYESGACNNCGHVCGHTDQVSGDICHCGITLLKFTVGNSGEYVYNLVGNKTFTDVVAVYSDFTLGSSNNVLWKGYVLVTADGELVKASDAVMNGHGYNTCQHVKFNGAVCALCGFTCAHPNFTVEHEHLDDDRHVVNTYCVVCEYSESAYEDHNYTNSICNVCAFKCTHTGVRYEYENHDDKEHLKSIYCDSCSYSDDVLESHTYVNAHCSVCSYDCLHTEKIVVAVNKLSDEQHREITECVACSKSDVRDVAHKFLNGACVDCGFDGCVHETLMNILYYEYDEDQHKLVGTCAQCMKPDVVRYAAHMFQNGMCVACEQECPHTELINILYTPIDNEHHEFVGACAKCGQENIKGQKEHLYNSNGFCSVCRRECDHAGGVTYEQLNEQNHIVSTSCSSCGYSADDEEAHNFENGVCVDCGFDGCVHETLMNILYYEYDEDQHKLVGTCAQCMKPDVVRYAAHMFQNGMCVACEQECPHTELINILYTPIDNEHHEFVGACAKCGQENIKEQEEHFYNSDGICPACMQECVHSYLNGVCSCCNLICVHPNYDNLGRCQFCDFVCKHTELINITYSIDDDQYHKAQATCKKCGVTVVSHLNHNYENGVCSICTHECGHENGVTYEKLNEKNHVLSISCHFCGLNEDIEESHVYKNGICTTCNYECLHELIDGSCSICGFNEISFTIDGVLFEVDQGSTWSDFMLSVPALGLTVDGDEMMYGEHYIKDSENFRVKASDEIHSLGAYFAYPHVYKDGVCENCGHECEHYLCSGGDCTTCGIACPHKLVEDGRCLNCGEEIE